MKSIAFPSKIFGLCFPFFAMVGIAILGQDTEKPSFQDFKIADLPSARVVIEGYIEAIGGYEVLESRDSVHIQYDATKNGESFDCEIFLARGKYYSSSRYETGRWFERGINDGVAWTRINGVARQLEGEELNGILARHRNVSAAPSWMDDCKSIKCVAIEFVNRRPAYRLEFIDQQGIQTDRYFDCQQQLLVRSVSREIHGAQQPRVVRDYFDYRKIAESQIPMKRRIVAGTKTYQYDVKQFEVDGRIPPGTFDLPPNIQRRP